MSIQMYGDRGKQPFPAALHDYLELRRGKLGERTANLYRKYGQALSSFFHEFRLEQIEIGHIVAYQRERQCQIRESKQHAYAKEKLGEFVPGATDGASIVNHEISCVLQQMLRLAGLWSPLSNFYEPLPLPKHGPGIALTEEEEKHLFAVAAKRPRWMVALCCSLISRNTTAGPGEIRHLRIRNVDLEHRYIRIEEAVKCEVRVRTLPLNEDALAAVKWLFDRYRSKLADLGIPEHPEHYLIPHRATKKGQGLDPWRPIGSWKKAFYSLRAEAGKKYPRLATLRRYDLRHTVCTLMLEDPNMSFTTIEKMMGHRLGSKVKGKYEHIRDKTLRAAADAIGSSHARELEALAPKLELVPATKKPVQNVAVKLSGASVGTVLWHRQL